MFTRVTRGHHHPLIAGDKEDSTAEATVDQDHPADLDSTGILGHPTGTGIGIGTETELKTIEIIEIGLGKGTEKGIGGTESGT